MKKIYIFTAVLALLTLSLNAQLKAHKNGTAVPPKSSTEQVDKEVTKPDGYFRMGPSRVSTNPVTPPYSNDFNSSDKWNWWETIDVDGDGSSYGNGQWSLYNNQARYYYHSSHAADDWLITAPVTLKAGKIYKFSFLATTSSSYDERLEVKLASSNSETALSNGTEIIPSTAFRASSGRTFSNENITVSADGNYYFGIHAISDANMYYLYIDNVVIDVEITDPTIQTSASSVTMNSIPGGTETQTVTVTGLYLTDNITTSIGGTNAAMFSVSPASLGTSGGELTISYTPTAVGTHTATLTLSSTDADDVTVTLNGTCEEKLTICEGTSTNSNLPIYGNYAEQLQINQMIYPAGMLTDLVGKDITSMTFYVDGTLDSKLGNDTWSVKLGTTDQTSYGSTISGASRLATTDEVYSGYLTTGNNTLTITFSHPFSYTSGNLVVDFQEMTTSGDYSATSFYGANQTGDYTGFYSRTGSTSNQDQAAQTNGHYTIGEVYQFLPKVTFTYEDSEPRHDLSIALSAPASVVGGNTATVTATVTNTGNQPMTGYTVTISDGTNNLLNQTVTEPLAPGATATFTTEYNTTEAQVGTTVNFAANVACTDDVDATNNNATASTSVITLPPPENVAATTGSNQSATMTWDAPTIESTAATVTENFDDTSVFPSFSIGGITATQHTGTIGNWTVYDPSGLQVYGFQSITFENSGSPQAWIVFNPSSAGSSQTTHSGNQMMTSFCVGSSTTSTDHWLISPELSGNAQTITFWNREINEEYGAEIYEVLVSSTNNDPTSFTKIADLSADDQDNWVQQTVSLPEDTKYFAIRHTARDVFGLMIDDITYEGRVYTDPTPVSYNIYLDGQLEGNVDANTFSYDFSNVTAGEHECAVSAVYPGGIESAAVPATFFIQAQTAAPTIGISSTTDNQVTITATGNGTVTLTINGQTVEGNGSASITLPRQMQDYTVSASATAQVSGELISTTTTETITVPGMSNDGWIEMTGTYNNPNDLLSFLVYDAIADTTKQIMMIDQFLAPTVNNGHPSSYTYVLKETINGEEKSSNPATVPVYKTNSTMYSLYTEEEVLADNKYDGNKLKANVLNSEIDYDVVPDNNVLYYSLYRGGKDEPTPVVDVDHRISQLQKYEEKYEDNEGEHVQYYLTENHLSGITPRYEHIGSQTVERLDTNYVIGTDENKLSYVPVIWTFGLYTARGDGKNNSYGSDIKNSYLGKVNISVEGYKNDENNTTGQWVYQDGSQNGITYCVYSPIITLNGFTPEDGGANDGDTYQYVPYMYRVWCTYTNAHNFTFLANPDGRKHLVDAGPIEAPFLIGEVTADDPAWNNNGEEVTIGRALASGEEQQLWSFGVPKTEDSKNVEFVARFYYKKIVTPAAQANGLRGNRGSERAFAIAQNSDDGSGIVTGISELSEITYVVSKTYVNAQGMQSDKPFDGLNIVVTRFSDGTTTTTKVVR